MLLKASPVTGDGTPAVALRETLRVSHGRAPLLDRHLARLASGGAGPSVLARVRSAVVAQLARPEAQSPYMRLGITVTPDGEVAAGLTAAESSLAVPGGPRIAVVAVDAGPSLPDGAAKPASRRYWDRAHHTARARGADQAVLVDSDGMLIDGSTATVWLVRDGELLTPLSPPAVAGVVRELVFDVAAQSGLTARETPLHMSDLESAEEAFLSNAVGLVVPVRGRGGEVYARISQQVRRLFATNSREAS
jgi:branched-chain amino acid aminotransferase